MQTDTGPPSWPFLKGSASERQNSRVPPIHEIPRVDEQGVSGNSGREEGAQLKKKLVKAFAMPLPAPHISVSGGQTCQSVHVISGNVHITVVYRYRRVTKDKEESYKNERRSCKANN